MAGYCCIVEEIGLIGFGETEFDAISGLFGKATKTGLRPQLEVKPL